MNRMPHDPNSGAPDFRSAFSDPGKVARYTDGPPRFLPGMDALHRMTGILLAEHVPEDATILVLGAGGGMELKALAEAHPAWRFVGVDPSRAMLGLAKSTLGALSERVELIEGYIEDAPPGPFDGATCLLTLHFLGAVDRQRTLEAIRRRLKTGAPLVTAHGSFPQDNEADRDRWLSRYAAYGVASGADLGTVRFARAAVAAGTTMLAPAQDEAILCQAGFRDVQLFFAAFTWRGWVAYALNDGNSSH